MDGQRDDLGRYGEVISIEDGRVTFRIPKAKTASATSRLLAELPVTDLTVADPPIEEVIDHVFAGGAGVDSEPRTEPMGKAGAR